MHSTEDYIEDNNKLFAKLAWRYDWIENLLWLVRGTVVSLIGAEQKQILDVACGTGTLAIELAKRGHEVIGIDTSIAMLKVAKTKLSDDLKCKFVLNDAREINVVDNSYDVVTISFALHDMPYSVNKDVLIELKRILKPNGKIIITDYHQPSNKLLVKLVKNVPRLWESEHFNSYIQNDLTKLIKVQGLNIKMKKLQLFGFVQVLVCEN